MKRAICITATFLILVFSILLSGCSKKAQEENVLAEFNGQIVKADELEKEISELPSYKQKKYQDKAGREEYLVLMAESRMLLKVANDAGLSKDEKILKEVQDYKDQLVVKELVKREVDDKVAIIDGDLSRYYEGHKEDYLLPEKVAVTEITVKDEAKAKEIMKKIKAGADFTKLAKEMDATGETFGPGQGNEGKTSPFSLAQFSNAKEFAEACFALEVGQISDIIVQPMRDITYYMIARLDERVAPRQQELDEVRDRIKRLVEKEKKKERMDKWLADIKEKHNYKLYPERIPEVPVPAEEKAAEEKTEGAEKPAEEGKAEETEKPAEEKTGTEETPEKPADVDKETN